VAEVNELPDVPLDVPLTAEPRRFRRAPVVAPAPHWAGPVYLGLAVILIPWAIYLGFALPDHTTAGHWDVAWAGFDGMEILALGLTAWFAYRRSTWVDLTAVATATLLIVDAWFDCTTARGSWPLTEAILLAVFGELPLAVLSLWIARHAQVVNETVTRWLIDRSTRQAERLRVAPPVLSDAVKDEDASGTATAEASA
jgi:hypothetical protein